MILIGSGIRTEAVVGGRAADGLEAEGRVGCGANRLHGFMAAPSKAGLTG